MLRPLLNSPATRHPDLIIGLEYADDGGVFMTPGGDALVQTVDFFTPVVDEPYDWGRIAAANALSDVYAMGGHPLTALQLVSWPRDTIPFSVLQEVMAGGVSVLELAACTLVGGHSVDDPEPKYGFAITGIIEPNNLMTNAGARPGDRLVLTKPLGTGIVATGIKRGVVNTGLRDRAVEVMVALNDGAARAMVSTDVHAATDVTGYGLLGHLRELLASAGVGAVLSAQAVPVLDGVHDLVAQGVFPGGSERNLASVAQILDVDGVSEETVKVLADAQTSGGLLISCPEQSLDDLLAGLGEHGTLAAAVIGTVTADDPGRIRLTP